MRHGFAAFTTILLFPCYALACSPDRVEVHHVLGPFDFASVGLAAGLTLLFMMRITANPSAALRCAVVWSSPFAGLGLGFFIANGSIHDVGIRFSSAVVLAGVAALLVAFERPRWPSKTALAVLYILTTGLALGSLGLAKHDFTTIRWEHADRSGGQIEF